MRQHTTKEQWNELNDNEQDLLYEKFSKGVDRYPYQNNTKDKGICLLSIGQMIEFLGDGWMEDIGIAYNMDMDSFNPELFYQYEPNHICDALWYAVKCKLK